MADTMHLSKELIARAQADMERKLDAPEWTLRQKLALTCRILFDGGHDSGLARRSRAREAGRYTQRLGLGFDEITADNLLVVDEDLRVQEGGGMPNPANRFHSWIYRARPDVNCIIHTHPLRGVLVDAGGAAGNLAHGQLSAVRRCGLPEGLARRAGRQ